MFRKSLFISICLFLGVLTAPAQTPGCIEGGVSTELVSPDRKIAEAEQNLCAEIEQNQNLQAIYGFVLSPKYGRVVRVYQNRAVFTYYENIARYRELQLSGKEFANLKAEIAKVDPLTQLPIRNCVDMCATYEFISLTRKGGRRVPIIASYGSPPDPLRGLMNLFRKWESFSGMETQYYLQEEYPEAQVLLTDESYSARAVWKKGDDLRILVFNKVKPFDTAFSWRKFTGGRLGKNAEQPLGIEFLGKNGRDSCGRLMVINHHPFQKMLGDYELCVGIGTKAGLWKVGGGKEIKIAAGEYTSPLITPDRKWIIAAKSDEDKPVWKSIVRINAKTNKEYRVDLPVADCFYPSAYVPVQNKILLIRCKATWTEKENNPSPEPPEYYLLEAETGDAKLIKDEIRPLMHQAFRFLQPTARANEFWAAIPDTETEKTEIGRYNLQNFKFAPVMVIPSIIFYSYDLWMDEDEKSAYVVNDFHLIRLPLREMF